MGVAQWPASLNKTVSFGFWRRPCLNKIKWRTTERGTIIFFPGSHIFVDTCMFKHTNTHMHTYTHIYSHSIHA